MGIAGKKTQNSCLNNFFKGTLNPKNKQIHAIMHQV